MKRVLFSLLTMFATVTTLFADVKIVGNNFPDDNFRVYLLNQSYGKDGVITTAEIANITKIEVPSYKIESLEGIQYFTALKTLNCDNNKLTSLDVSKNTKLTSLNCSGNQIRGAAMDALINSLPSVSSGTFYAINLTNEGNVMTASRVAAAKTKGWKTWYTESGTIWSEYAGAPEGIEIEERNFPDENFRNFLLEKSYGKDCIITDDEIKGVTYMNIESKNVASLQGIEYFTALELLWVFGNSINSLDLSKNTSLKELYCNYNSLTELNVKGCNALEILCCNRNNLTQVDMSGCPSLKTLRCDQNQIKGAAMDALIASLTNVNGGELWVTFNESEGNEITASQISDAKKKGWTAKYNDGTKWQEFAEESIAINEDNFPDWSFRNWVLSQSYGEDGILTEEEIASITRINVRNSDIHLLKGIEYFTAITYLVCAGNYLSSLDLTNNTNLQTLSCSNNNLIRLDLSKNTELTNINCSGNQLTSLDVTGLTKLKVLECYQNQLTSLNVAGCTALATLRLHQNNISGENMDSFIESLPNVSSANMCVIYNESENNVITASQIADAKNKGWKTLYTTDGSTWKEYEGSEPEVKKCATPTITVVNGKCVLDCETEDVKYICKIEFENEGNVIGLPSKIIISVYATKEGYEPSDSLTLETSPKVLLDKFGDVNGDGTINGTDIQEVINIIVGE